MTSTTIHMVAKWLSIIERREDMNNNQIIKELEQIKESICLVEDLETDRDVGYLCAQKDFIEMLDERISALKSKGEKI